MVVEPRHLPSLPLPVISGLPQSETGLPSLYPKLNLLDDSGSPLRISDLLILHGHKFEPCLPDKPLPNLILQPLPILLVNPALNLQDEKPLNQEVRIIDPGTPFSNYGDSGSVLG